MNQRGEAPAGCIPCLFFAAPSSHVIPFLFKEKSRIDHENA